MEYPTIRELLDREAIEMSWKEFGSYLAETTELTENQAYIVAGKSYREDISEIAEYLGTTEQSVRVQHSKLELANGKHRLEGVSRREVIETPVPGSTLRYVGGIEYFHSNYWPPETHTSEVQVFVSVEGREYVCVIEKLTVTSEEGTALDREPPTEDDELFGIVENVERTVIYESFEAFTSSSPHAPNQLPTEVSEVEMEVDGDLYQEYLAQVAP